MNELQEGRPRESLLKYDSPVEVTNCCQFKMREGEERGSGLRSTSKQLPG